MCGGLWKVIYCWGFELFHNGVCVGDNPGAVMGVMMLFNVLLILNYYLLCIMTADIPVCTVYMLGVSLKLWNITQSMLCRVQLITFPFQQKAHTIDWAPVVLQCHQNLDTGPSSLYHSPPPAFFFTIHIETSSSFFNQMPFHPLRSAHVTFCFGMYGEINHLSPWGSAVPWRADMSFGV